MLYHIFDQHANIHRVVLRGQIPFFFLKGKRAFSQYTLFGIPNL